MRDNHGKVKEIIKILTQKNHMKYVKKSILIIVLFHISINLVFANDQTYVIGIGAGGASYKEKPEFFYDSEIITKGGNINFEWYLFNSIGLGLKTVSLQSPDSVYSKSDGTTGGEQGIYQPLTIDSNLITINWIISGEKDYSRFGLTFGAGNSKLTKITRDGVGYSSSGSATSLGIFFDWGADGFGARLGYDSVSNSFGEFKSGSRNVKNITGTGGLGYFGLRWAF